MGLLKNSIKNNLPRASFLKRSLITGAYSAFDETLISYYVLHVQLIDSRYNSGHKTLAVLHFPRLSLMERIPGVTL